MTDLELSEMTLLKFKDFVPEIKTKARHTWKGTKKTEYSSLMDVLREANTWLVNQPEVDLVNVETVVLPSIHADKEEGSEDPELIAYTGGYPQAWHQFIRVWYMEKR
ncbi:MAG: hypothetical protein AAF399_13380 [Bacteroidota bacterium]